jgi:hypothetical protein
MSGYDDTTEARRRFYMLANLEQAKKGLPPIAEPAPELPPAMQKFVSMQRGGATQGFIEMNAQRVAKGLPPLGASGQPVMSNAGAQPTAPAQSDPATEAFFKGQTDFEGKPDPAYASIKVKRYNQ